MKKILSFMAAATLLLTAISFTACQTNVSTDAGNAGSSGAAATPAAASSSNQNSTVVSKVTKIDGSKANKYNFFTIDLSAYNEKTVTVEFSTSMYVEHSGTTDANLKWQIYTYADSNYKNEGTLGDQYPEIVNLSAAAGKTTDWTTVSGTKEIYINQESDSNKPYFYLNSNGVTDYASMVIYLDNFTLKITPEGEDTKTLTVSDISANDGVISEVNKSSAGNWISSSVPSLYETYKNYFDYFGFAVEYGLSSPHTELYYSEIQKGMKKHANTISLGNEFKPDFVFNWGWWRDNYSTLVDFTASNGKTIKVPKNIPTFTLQDEILQLCQTLGIHMRGHVLLWHSQTPDQFFYENFGYAYDEATNKYSQTNTTLVDAETMDARLEWYIKTVVQHCDTFTIASDGKPVIWAWDVANECTSDGSTGSAATSTTDSDWLRTSGSKWYTVYSTAKAKGDTNYYTGTTYNSYDFVVNAFRFANKYANTDTKLVYNDYGGLNGTGTSNKHQSQLRLVQAVLDHKNDASYPTRIDAMGLQSHYSVRNSASAYQEEIQDFIAKGLDVQITELDIATCENYDVSTDTVGCSGKQFNSLADAYSGFMKMFIDNRKTAAKHGVTCITIWGLSDQQTWLNTIGQNQWNGNCQQYPLLFNLINNVDSATNTYEFYTDNTKSSKTSLTLPSFDDGDSYSPKAAFYAVINAAKNYGN